MRKVSSLQHSLTREMFYTKKTTQELSPEGELLDKNSYTRVTPRKAVAALVKHSDFQFTKFFPSLDRIYIYFPVEGVYKRVSVPDFKLILSAILDEVDPVLVDVHFINNIHKLFNLSRAVSYVGSPHIDMEFVAFDNGLLHLPTGKLQDFTPSIFTTIKISYCWNPDTPIPHFLKFLESFAGRSAEKIGFYPCFYVFGAQK